MKACRNGEFPRNLSSGACSEDVILPGTAVAAGPCVVTSGGRPIWSFFPCVFPLFLLPWHATDLVVLFLSATSGRQILRHHHPSYANSFSRKRRHHSSSRLTLARWHSHLSVTCCSFNVPLCVQGMDDRPGNNTANREPLQPCLQAAVPRQHIDVRHPGHTPGTGQTYPQSFWAAIA